MDRPGVRMNEDSLSVAQMQRNALADEVQRVAVRLGGSDYGGEDLVAASIIVATERLSGPLLALTELAEQK